MNNGADVRKQRIAAGVQQKDLAAYLGVTHQKMNAWELGRQDMPMCEYDKAVAALDAGRIPKSGSKLSIIGRKDAAGAADATMALFNDSVASMEAGTLSDATGLFDGTDRKTVRDAIAEIVADMTGCGADTAYKAYDSTHGHRADIADEVATIERSAREMHDAEWQRLADMSSAAERLGWRASMTVIDDDAEYVIETDGCHIMVAPDDVEAFMRGAAWALGK